MGMHLKVIDYASLDEGKVDFESVPYDKPIKMEERTKGVEKVDSIDK